MGKPSGFTPHMARGVYTENYASDGGREIIVAVDSYGRRVGWFVLPGQENKQYAALLMRNLLALHTPTLTAVPGAGTSERPSGAALKLEG